MNNHHHKFARTTPYSRALLVHRALTDKRPVFQVADEFGISTRTVNKWITRYKAEGEAVPGNRSSAPLHSPYKLPKELVALIRQLVVQFGMRARAIAHQFKLAYATVTRVLRRLKLTASTKSTPKSNRYEHESCLLYTSPSPRD